MTFKVFILRIVVFVSYDFRSHQYFQDDHTKNEGNLSYKCKAEDYPFLVLLRSEHGRTCGGVLIKYDTVMTASYCVKDFEHNPEKIEVLFNVSTHNPNGTERSSAKKIFVRPNPNKSLYFHNISVIVLGQPIRSGRPIKLPQNSGKNSDKICKNVQTLAYTYETLIGSYTIEPQLYCLDLLIVTEDKCSKIDGKYTDAISCRFLQRTQLDKACRDYLGYPVFCRDTLYGIVANGGNCTSSDVADYRVNVDFVIDLLHKRSKRRRLARFIEKKKSSSCQMERNTIILVLLYCSVTS